MIKTDNFDTSNYLLNCDLINKYNLNSYFCIPKIKRITASVSIKDLCSSVNLAEKEEEDFQKIKFFIIFHLFALKEPYIKIKETKPLTKKLKTDKKFYLNCIFSDKKEINNFLIYLFIENPHLSKYIRYRTKFVKENKLVAKFKIPILELFDLHYLITSVYSSTILKDVYLNITVSIEKFDTKTEKGENLLKNMPYFWLS